MSDHVKREDVWFTVGEVKELTVQTRLGDLLPSLNNYDQFDWIKLVIEYTDDSGRSKTKTLKFQPSALRDVGW